MRIEFTRNEILLLIKLVELELQSINAEIRHSATSNMREQLREERRMLPIILERLCSAGEEKRAVGNL